MQAPGTLSDEQQVRFNAQLLSLVRGFYGEDAQYALAVLKFIPNEGAGGIALYTMGSTDSEANLQRAFMLAADSMLRARMRKLAMEEGEPDSAKN